MRKSIIFIAIICLSISPLLLAQSTGTGANFLKIGVGPRAIGLGSAFTGVGDDVYTLYWNPAGIGFIRRWEYSAMYNNYFADMYFGALTGVRQFRILGSRKTAIGVGLFYHGMPNWDATQGRDSEEASASNFLGVVSLGQRLDWLLSNLSIGINGKLGMSKLMNESAYTIAADAGIMYRLDVWNKPLTLGVAVQNIGFQTAFISQKFPLPFGFRVGASYRILGCPWHYLLFATDVSNYKYGNLKVGFGAEYWLHGIIGFRGGYSYAEDDLGDISFGASIRFDQLNSGLQSDYAQTDFGNAFGYDQKGSISIQAVRPEPFRLLAPPFGHYFCYGTQVVLQWENSEDADLCDLVTYRVLVDPNDQKIAEAMQLIENDFRKETGAYLDLATEDVTMQLPQLAPQTYYWTIVAVDKKGHSQPADEIRTFDVEAPDLHIRELAYLPSDTLPDFEDDYQGIIQFVIENSSRCAASNFKVILTDSFCCNNDRENVDEYLVKWLGPFESDSYQFKWHTEQTGKHHFKVHIDPEDKVYEVDELNNMKLCSAVTIPRGKVYAERDTLSTKKIEFTHFEIPIIPVIFFDTHSFAVDQDFYKQDWIHPIPVLKVIADRLRENENLKIKLAGYIDSYNETGQSELANNRMKTVYHILIDTLGVSPAQVELAKNYDPTERHIARRPEPMVNEENRRVAIDALDENNETRRQLFGPVEFLELPRITDGQAFDAELKAYTDIVSWQILVREPGQSKPLYRNTFRLDPSSNIFHLHDRAVWVGNDLEEKLVRLNYSYFYQIEIQDKLGRKFLTTPRKFYLKCETVQEQQLQVHSNHFDSVEEYFPFNTNRLMQVADVLIGSPSLHVKFQGYSCEIGETDYNLNLAYNRAESFRERFIKILKRKHAEIPNPIETWAELLARVEPNLTKAQLAEKFKGHPGGFNEPIRAYKTCALKEIIYSDNIAYHRNINRRVDIVLFNEKALGEVAKTKK